MSDLNAFTGQTLNQSQAQQVLNQATGLIQGWTGQTLFQVVNDTVAGLRRDAAYLIRPDSYVALADAEASPRVLAAYLDARKVGRAATSPSSP